MKRGWITWKGYEEAPRIREIQLLGLGLSAGLSSFLLAEFQQFHIPTLLATL